MGSAAVLAESCCCWLKGNKRGRQAKANSALFCVIENATPRALTTCANNVRWQLR